MRPIGNVCYDLQQRAHTAIDLYAWSIVASCDRLYDRSIVISCYRAYDQLLLPATDRTSNRGILWPSVPSIVASDDRWYNQSRGLTIKRCNLRPIVRSIVAPDDRSYDQSWHPTTDRTINRSIGRSIVRSVVRLPISDHSQLVVPPCTTCATTT